MQCNVITLSDQLFENLPKLSALTYIFLKFWLYRALCKVAFSRIENVLGNKCNTISAYTMKNSKYTSFILKRKKDQTKPTEE